MSDSSSNIFYEEKQVQAGFSINEVEQHHTNSSISGPPQGIPTGQIDLGQRAPPVFAVSPSDLNSTGRRRKSAENFELKRDKARLRRDQGQIIKFNYLSMISLFNRYCSKIILAHRSLLKNQDVWFRGYSPHDPANFKFKTIFEAFREFERDDRFADHICCYSTLFNITDMDSNL